MDVDSNDENSDNTETSKIPEKTPDVAVNLKVDDTKNVKVDIANIPLVSYAPKMKSPTISGKRFFFTYLLAACYVYYICLWFNLTSLFALTI